MRTSEKSIQAFLDSKSSWIQRHRNRILSQEREVEKKYVDGEVYLFLGNKISMRTHEISGKSSFIKNDQFYLDMFLRPKTSFEKKEKLLKEWYRQQLGVVIQGLLEKWEPILGVKVQEWNVKQMKTCWGICYPKRKKIILNLALATKSISHIEYIVVHELIHFYERYHNKKFYHLMDKYLPTWRSLQKTI